MKAKVGYSVDSDSFLSGSETARKATEGTNAKVGLLFTSCVLDQKKIVEGIKSVTNVPFIGCTSSAAIVVPEAGYIDNETGYTGMLSFEGEDLTVGVAGSPRNEEPREVGKRIAREAIKNAGVSKIPSYFCMIASPKEEEEYLKGIQDVIGRVPMFGGSAADNEVAGKWSIICNDQIFDDGCAVAFFFANNEIRNVYTGDYEETENVGIITKVSGKRTLVEIDHVPAIQKYAEWTGKDIESLKGGNLLVETITAPLGVKDVLGDVTAVRHPMNGNDDLSMEIGANLEVGTAVIQLKGSVDQLVASAKRAVERVNREMKKEPVAYYFIYCGGRRLGCALAHREKELYDAIKDVVGNKPFLMGFTFGEYGSNNHSANTTGGLSISFTGFSE